MNTKIHTSPIWKFIQTELCQAQAIAHPMKIIFNIHVAIVGNAGDLRSSRFRYPTPIWGDTIGAKNMVSHISVYQQIGCVRIMTTKMLVVVNFMDTFRSQDIMFATMSQYELWFFQI